MPCFNVLFVALLIAGVGLLEFICFGWTNIKYSDPISEFRFENEREDAGVRIIEAHLNREDVDHFLFPRESNDPSRNQNRQRSNEDQRRRSFVHRKDSTTATPSTRGNRANVEITPSLKRSSTKSGNKDPFDPTAVLECIVEAIETSLPTVVSYTTAIPTKTLFNRVASVLRTTPPDQPPTVAISQDMVESFVEAAEPCFSLLPYDKKGIITLPEDFETSPAAEAIKQQPMGILALGAVQAVANNVRVTFSRRWRSQYQYAVNHEGLAHELEMAAVKTKQIGQTVLKSPQGTSWFTKSISQNAKETGAEQDMTSAHDIPISTRKQVPTTVKDLLECIWDAAKATLPVGAVANRAFGNFKKQLSTMPTVGFFLKKSDEAATESSGKPSKIITVKELQAFVKKVTPCLGFFTRNEKGELDPTFLKSAAIEVARLNPTGALVIGVAKALTENVTQTQDKEGKATYRINYEGLTTGLGLAVMDATKFGRVLRFCSHIASIKPREKPLFT